VNGIIGRYKCNSTDFLSGKTIVFSGKNFYQLWSGRFTNFVSIFDEALRFGRSSLHYGYIPSWLAERMAKLQTSMIIANISWKDHIVSSYPVQLKSGWYLPV
jgi:hypothetical protein